MKLRLIYSGELKSTNGEARGNQKNKLAPLKWKIRKQFHDQLKVLWNENPILKDWTAPRTEFFKSRPVSDTVARFSSGDTPEPLSDLMADKHIYDGKKFIPLAMQHLNLICSLDILFLRRDAPGKAIQAGDIDNRIKTLIDGLRMPKSPNEMNGFGDYFKEDEPIYCLLTDDDQITSFSVETDTLLKPKQKGMKNNEVEIILTVEIKPYQITFNGAAFL